jgi:hypothetical protein
MDDIVADAVETLGAVGEDLSDPKLYSAEESVERLARVKFCCIRSLTSVMQLLFATAGAEPGIAHARDSLLSSDFIVLAKLSLALLEGTHPHNTVPFAAVRRVIYEWLSSAVTLLPSGSMAAHSQQLADMLPHILEEKSPENMPAMWTAVLQILRWVAFLSFWVSVPGVHDVPRAAARIPSRWS